MTLGVLAQQCPQAHQVSERSLLPFSIYIYPPGEFTDKTIKEPQVKVGFMNERVILERGDALHFNAQKPHRLRSVGDVQAQLLVVVHSAEE